MRSCSFMTGGPLQRMISASGMSPTTSSSPRALAYGRRDRYQHVFRIRCTYLAECIGMAVMHHVKATVHVHADWAPLCGDGGCTRHVAMLHVRRRRLARCSNSLDIQLEIIPGRY